MSIKGDQLLAAIPKELREPLLNTFLIIEKNFREGRWEPSELNGGKLCEIIYSILEGLVKGKYPSKPVKPKNMVDACRNLENADQTKFSRSIRVQIPRMLIALYEIRNSRGVGHVGGDLDPNHMDALQVLSMSQWLIAELVRIFHGVSTTEAQGIVDGIVIRKIPIVWMVGKKKRVLEHRLIMSDQVLLLLHDGISPVAFQDLMTWVEHSHASNFRRDVLRNLHDKRLIEFDEKEDEIRISPKGMAYVEKNLPLTVPTD